ncbi:YdcF family protein [Aerococcaceae bacterium NML171108]|nr:YdcF family protein [Aerococcaceae bacterium NML171108]
MLEVRVAVQTLWRWCVRLVSFSIASVILVVGGINLFVILFAQSRTLTVEELTQSTQQAKVPILILGAGVINNETPSSILAKRLDKALEVHQALPNNPLIASGDHREDNYNEVAVMKHYLIEHGVDSNQIYLDHAGYSTYDSLYRFKKVLNQDKIIIVTQGYHLSRALLLADSLGIDAVGVAADEVPSTRWQREVREIGARLKDFAVAYLGYRPPQPEEAYAFSLQESGDLTNTKESLRND